MRKNILRNALLAAVLLLSACGSDNRGSAELREDGFRTGRHDYKSIIRLWPEHHEDSVVLSQLVEAFRKYPGACDEVWFCVSEEKEAVGNPEIHRRSARLMGQAAEKMREIGVRPSIQTVLLGHPESESAWNQPSPYPWSPIVSVDGISGKMQSCPRQREYLEWISDIQAIYAEEVQPDTFFIDDDLRLTNHDPAASICFCDTCIGLFNEQYGYSFSRETLAKALTDNCGGGEVRRQWIEFSQESLAGVARIVARKVHKVSPQTQMGLQNVAFHFNLLEGWDWNRIFDAMEEETGIVPASRPGHGYYKDHSPREMLYKSLGIARQVSRLSPGITDISPEIEGYLHKATGKSSLSFCTETLLYLAYGATQMSYAMICSGQEPVCWYADHHFKMLDSHHSFFNDYVLFNQGTRPGGLDPYISPFNVYRNCASGEDPWAWTKTAAGEEAVWLNAIGLPLCPESERASALYIDAPSLQGIPDGELKEILSAKNVLTDLETWNEMRSRLPEEVFTEVELPENLKPEAVLKSAGFKESPTLKYVPTYTPLCFLTGAGKRVAVLPSFSADVNNAQRLQILRTADWASDGSLPVILESPAQGVVVPRLGPESSLRSVAYLNCTITEQEDAVLRLRGCPAGAKLVWKMAGQKDVSLKPQWNDGELLVHLPAVPAWHIGWIAVE